MSRIKELYYSDLKKIPRITEEELKSLKESFDKDPKTVKGRLSEGLLYLVRILADATEVDDADYMDLVQEGNLSLLTYIAEMESIPDDLEMQAKLKISEGMIAFLQEEKENKSAANTIAAKLNILDDFTKKYSEENDEAPTAKQIAEILHTDEEEIEYLLKMALSAVNKE